MSEYKKGDRVKIVLEDALVLSNTGNRLNVHDRLTQRYHSFEDDEALIITRLTPLPKPGQVWSTKDGLWFTYTVGTNGKDTHFVCQDAAQGTLGVKGFNAKYPTAELVFNSEANDVRS